MITKDGYSKESFQMREGIVLTLPKIFFQERGMSYAEFDKMFVRFMQKEDSIWNFRLTNLPLHDVAFVYLIWDGLLRYGANLVQYERGTSKRLRDAPDGQYRDFPAANWVIFTGPIIKCPFERRLPGFQGFRYSTKLF